MLLDQRLAVLRAVPGVDGAALDALARTLTDPDDWKAFRLNPLRFSEEHGLLPQQTIELFLHATRVGVLELRFNLLCPGCGAVEYQVTSMDAVPSGKWHCVVCARDIDCDLDDRVEVSFTPELGVRELKLDRFADMHGYMRFYFSANFERSPELETFLNALTLGVFAVKPGETVSLELDAEEGRTYRLLSLDTHTEVRLVTSAQGASGVEVLALPAGLGPREVSIAPGRVSVRVVNRGSTVVGFVATRIEWERLYEIVAKHPNRMRPFLTAKALLNNQTFRELFRVQTLDADLRLRLRSLTLLFTDLKGSTELYDRTGDLRAYAFVREHFKLLTEAVKRHRGAIIKTMGDAIMASFNEPTDAVHAALEMMRGMDALNETLEREGHETGLKVGLHEGPALAVTSDERLDYFGQTVNVAARVQGLAQAGEIWLTPSVLEAPGVERALAGAGWRGERKQVALKGVGGQTNVHRMIR
jgi:class 3 adenylate cyclase